MRICIVGTGAMGGLLGTKLAVSGQDVTFIDKGEQLAALRDKGIKLLMEDGREFSIKKVRALADFVEAGPQDVVILALKAHQIEDVAEKLPALFLPETCVVTVQNGIPWWYFQNHGGEYEGRRLHSLDPTGIIEGNIETRRIVGCVPFPGAEVVSPGVIRHVEGNRFPVGELDGSESERCRKLVQVLTDSDFKAFILEDIRSEIWLKLWGNLSLNPISALTHASIGEICHLPETRNLLTKMMEEAKEIAQKLGIHFRHTIEKRISGAERAGDHKTSMLQDVRQGRILEIEALLGAVIELARLTEKPAPSIEAVYACTKLLNKVYMNAESRVDLISVLKN